MKKFFKRWTSIICLFCMLSLIGMMACTNNAEKNKLYIGDTFATWEKGLNMKVVNVSTASIMEGKFTTYKATGKFVIVQIAVRNNTNDIFYSFDSFVYLLYGETRLTQTTLIKNFSDTWDNIALSPTLTKSYYAVFDIGEQINVNELQIIIGNGFKHFVRVYLTEKPVA